MSMSRMTEAIGRVLDGRYRIIAPIGRGASAQVFLADDVRLRRRVAVKMLHAALADDADFLRRFQAEARAAAALNHPNVMAVYDWGQDSQDDVPYLVLEYLGGGSLRALLDQGHRLTPSQALLVGLEASRALEFAHRRGFVHRDIKPANVVFGDDGRLRIADFGLARALAEAAWTEPQGAVLGTARYSSPEQAQGQPLTGKADVYSLALVLVESVTGEVPFAADTTLGTLMARVDKPLEVPDSLGPLRDPLARAGHPHPDQRIDSHRLGITLMAAAGSLPRPEPLPLVGAVAAGVVDDGRDPTTILGGDRADALAPSTYVDRPGSGGDDLDVPGFMAAGAAGAGAAGTPADAHDAPAGSPEAPFDGWDDTVAQEGTAQPPAPVPWPAPDPTFVAPPPPAPAAMVPAAAALPEAEEGPRRRRRWPLAVFLVILLSGVGVAAGALVAGLTRTPTHAVPSVVGLDVTEARSRLTDLGWTVTERTTRLDGTRAGQVVGVTPAPGSRLDEGKQVMLLVSEGNTFAEVPPGLDGKSVKEASDLLAARGLAVATDPQFSENVAANTVIALAAGTRSKLVKGETVTLVVSRGPEPRTIPAGLAGRSAEEVKGLLEGLRLKTSTKEEFSDTVTQGDVIGTAPGAGAEVARDSTVQLVVSKGPPIVKVPDVSSASSPAEAAAILRAAGLKAGSVSGSADGRPTTRPAAGTDVPKGSTVDIVLRKGGSSNG